jgi:hypothetical protein
MFDKLLISTTPRSFDYLTSFETKEFPRRSSNYQTFRGVQIKDAPTLEQYLCRKSIAFIFMASLCALSCGFEPLC